MLKVAVIADDLTGAADTGVLFVPVVEEMRLLTAAQFGGFNSGHTLDGVAVCTDSRSMDRDAAGETVAIIAARLKSMGAELVYKKIDSCLRGHVGVELLRLLDACGRRGALIAPAYPRLGRATVHDIHYVLDVPVAQSEAGQDPIRPVTSSLLSENLAIGHEQPVGFVDISAVRGGEASMAEAVTKELTQGKRLIAVDAATDEDLALIADTALKFFPDLILSGSAGLAQAMAARLVSSTDRESACRLQDAPLGFSLSPDPLLFVGGSASSVLRAQLETLALEHDLPMRTLDAQEVLHGVSEPEKNKLADALIAQDLIICLSPPEPGQERLPSQALALALGHLAADLTLHRLTALSAVFASGGDTAQAVLNSLGNPEIIINCELAPGFIVSTLSSGPCSGLHFLTKSGSFGDPSMLSAVYGRLRPQMQKNEFAPTRAAVK